MKMKSELENLLEKLEKGFFFWFFSNKAPLTQHYLASCSNLSDIIHLTRYSMTYLFSRQTAEIPSEGEGGSSCCHQNCFLALNQQLQRWKKTLCFFSFPTMNPKK